MAERNMTQPCSEGLPLEIVDAILWEFMIDELLTILLSDNLVAVRNPCKVTMTARTLAEPYRTAFWQVITTTRSQGGFTADAAASKLAEVGISLGATTIKRHRRNQCKC